MRELARHTKPSLPVPCWLAYHLQGNYNRCESLINSKIKKSVFQKKKNGDLIPTTLRPHPEKNEICNFKKCPATDFPFTVLSNKKTRQITVITDQINSKNCKSALRGIPGNGIEVDPMSLKSASSTRWKPTTRGEAFSKKS